MSEQSGGAVAPLSDADLLRKLWRLNLAKIVEALESGEVNAAGLNVARQFLMDQGVNRQTLDTLDSGRATLATLRNLPNFDE
ncbi:MAG: hypothetical protein Q7J29_12960 [Stagnimonas sp.]|nr:hypothetical protein [Stagnimonas sp.]